MTQSPVKNRYTAPFGYTIEMGRLVIHPGEGEIVRQVFADYLAGASLKNIADTLAARNVEYLPGRSDWNKNRVKRILEDARYLGDAQFPALVDSVSFQAVQARKQERNQSKVIQPDAHISQVTVPIACRACGTAMTRIHDGRYKTTEIWHCPCGARVPLSDGNLLVGLTEVLNRIIADPAIITEVPVEPGEEQLLIVRRLQNEVSRRLEGFDFDRDAVQQDIFALAAAKYKVLPDHTTTQILRAAFEESTPLDSFSRELLEAAALQVLLGSDGVCIKLKNQQVIGKDDENAGDPPTATDGDQNPGEPGCPAAAGGAQPAAHRGLLPGEHQPGGTAPQL